MLREALAGARSGRGRLVLIAGEPGIGKSALAARFAAELHDQGVPVAWGRAWEFADAPPYFPLWPCLRALAVALPGSEGDRLDEQGVFRLWEEVLAALAAAATVVEVDAIQHKAHWRKASVEEIREGIQAALDGTPNWVIDGTCEHEVGDFIASRADLIVWLDLPLAVKLVRLLRRSWRRVRTREVLWNGNVETWRDVFVGRDSVVAHPLRTHFRHRRRTLARPDRAKLVRLRSTSEVNEWLSAMQQRRDPGEARQPRTVQGRPTGR